jgi:hypothetical protein
MKKTSCDAHGKGEGRVMDNEERLKELLLAWEELSERGQEVPAVELCKDCPELTEELPEPERKVLRLLWVHEMSVEEAAKLLRLRPTDVRRLAPQARLAALRGKTPLAKAMEQYPVNVAPPRPVPEQAKKEEPPGRNEPASLLDELFRRPQRSLSAEEVVRETERLLAVCREEGVAAVVPEVATCRPLLLSLADACMKAGLISEGHYLLYLDCPCD